MALLQRSIGVAFSRTHEFSFHWKEGVHSPLKTENENLEKTLISIQVVPQPPLKHRRETGEFSC